MENPKKFPDATWVITLISYSGGKQNVWDYLTAAKDSFPNIRMDKFERHKVNKLEKICSIKVSVLLQPCLYSALKLTLPPDVGWIVVDVQPRL